MSSEIVDNNLTVPTRRVPLKDLTNTISYVEPDLVLHNIVVVPNRKSFVVDNTTSYVSAISAEEMEKIRMRKRKQLKRL